MDKERVSYLWYYDRAKGIFIEYCILITKIKCETKSIAVNSRRPENPWFRRRKIGKMWYLNAEAFHRRAFSIILHNLCEILHNLCSVKKADGQRCSYTRVSHEKLYCAPKSAFVCFHFSCITQIITKRKRNSLEFGRKNSKTKETL